MASTATLHTNHGDIVIELFEDQAPKTVENFVGLANGTKEYTDPASGAKTREETCIAGAHLARPLAKSSASSLCEASSSKQ